MSQTRFAAAVCVIAAIGLFPSVASAQATRTWVSGVGDDANPCSRTAPCKTFSGAISKTAVSGEIDALDPGGFGAVTITKSITLDGTAGLAGVLVSGTNAIVVSAAGSDVIIRNLDLNGLGTGLAGILIVQAGDVRIENCKIYGFANRGIEDQRMSGHLSVLNTVVSNNGQTGILALPGGASSLNIHLDHVQMHSNGNAGFAITSGVQASVEHSSAVANTHGFYADSNALLQLEDSTAFGNGGTGINAQTGATILLHSTTVVNNAMGLSTTGGNILSFGQNPIAANGTGNGPPTGTILVQ